MDADMEWAQRFADVARELGSAAPGEVLSRVAGLATAVIGCPWVAVARATDTTPEVAAANDRVTGEQIAKIQSAGGGGPTWQAVAQRETVVVPDLTVETRWPDHVRELLATTPVRSIAAIYLHLDERPLGAMTCYADRPHGLPEEKLAAATIYADHAAIALDRERARMEREQLQTALETSREIGAAVGILMERHKLTVDQAFDMLRMASQHSNRKLRDVAADLVMTGRLQGAGGP